MKEFSAQNGGRYTYADDLENLQDLALAFVQIFDDCDNFVLSGCEIKGNSIGSGYVYLNGKLRYFSGATNLSGWPQYIIESNYTESVPYENGSSKVGRNIYGATIGNTIPTALDPLTNKIPSVLEVNASGVTRMKDAFIGKYALLLNSRSGSQRVGGLVNFGQNITAERDITTNGSIIIQNGANRVKMQYQGGVFDIVVNGDQTYKLVIEDGVGLKFYISENQIVHISDTSLTFDKPVSVPKGTFNGLVLSGNNIYQGMANDIAYVDINMLSFNGETTQYRNLRIGNGKNKAIITVMGASSNVDIKGMVTISPGSVEGLVLKGNASHTNNSLVNAIVWKDSANVVMARAGFVSTTDQIFKIVSPLYGISINGIGCVDICPAIKENGVYLSDKYANKSTVEANLSCKADISSVYSKSEANNKFGLLNKGLLQFVSAEATAAQCRSQIGALGISDLAVCAKLDNCLSDMATSDANKRKIRNNIGALGTEDLSLITNDSGWCATSVDTLKVRQIGNIVSIQGTINTVHNGTIFTIPNNIAPPTYAIEKTIGFINNRVWVCKIDANSRNCIVVHCDSACGRTTNFSLTYMV